MLELVQGPELFDLICEQKTFSEMVARKVCVPLFLEQTSLLFVDLISFFFLDYPTTH